MRRVMTEMSQNCGADQEKEEEIVHVSDLIQEGRRRDREAGPAAQYGGGVSGEQVCLFATGQAGAGRAG